MSCGPEAQRFRLLDGYVGWEIDRITQLDGSDVEGGALTLARVSGGVDPGELLPWFPPPALARGCGPCVWYLASTEGCLLVRDCTESFVPARGPLGRAGALAPPAPAGYFVSARDHLVAVSDPGNDRVWLLGSDGEEVRAVLAVAGVGALALGAAHELLVAVDGETRLRRYDGVGNPLPPLPAALPGTMVRRIAVGNDCALWIVTSDGGAWKLWRLGREGTRFEPRDLAALPGALPSTGISAADANGFCLVEPGAGGMPQTSCYGWDGCPPPTSPRPPAAPRYVTKGQLLTHAIASDIPRCRWHRVRIDADVPPGTQCWVDVATSEDPSPPPQGDNSGSDWASFPAGVPHPQDWQVTDPTVGNPLDVLIRQPPGQYIFVRLRLTSDGTATPTVRRIRLDLPRSTSLEHLPAVYRDSPDAEDFSERFLSLFDATIEQIDRAIVRAPALLDAGGVPDAVLPWLGAFLDLALDPAWTTAQRRRLLRAAPALYKIRGTRAGIVESIRLITGVTPTIVEQALQRSWGILAQDAQLGAIRLFGRARARVRIGRSKLGTAPLRSFGNPDQDPLSADAYRFTVLMPPGGVAGPGARARLQQLVGSIKPAHTLASLRVGGVGFVVGVTAMVGVDTVLGGLPPTVLGATRLSRNFVLQPGRHGRRLGFPVGAAALGVQTALQ